MSMTTDYRLYVAWLLIGCAGAALGSGREMMRTCGAGGWVRVSVHTQTNLANSGSGTVTGSGTTSSQYLLTCLQAALA